MSGKIWSTEARTVVIETAKRMNDIAATPEPPKWQTWAVAEWQELREFGARYEPRSWFGGGQVLPEKYRVKFLRAIHELAEAGLLVRGTLGGRTTHIRLTDEGLELAYELDPSLRPAEPKPKKKAAKKGGGTKRAKPAPAFGATDERTNEMLAPDAAAVGDVGAEGAPGE